jgi:TetR/AcrR family transcriptional regulator, transcriptional repressor for nem operon
VAGRPKQFDRDEVLGNALDVFWSRGYDATSLDDLTDAMGIGRASLYNEFGDKHTLFIEALDCYRVERLARITEVLTAAPSARAGIAAVFRGTVESLWADEGRRGCLVVNSTAELAASDAAVAARAAESFERTAGVFRSALMRGKRTGELDADLNVRATARHLASALNGLRLLAKVADRRVADDVVEVALKALD